MTLGQVIRNARSRRGWTQERLGKEVGLGQSTISALENDDLESRLDGRTLIQVAEALDDTSILAHHCKACPVRSHLFRKFFKADPEDRHNLSFISRQLRKEVGEACTVLDEIIAGFSAVPPDGRVGESEEVRSLLDKLAHVERGIGVLLYQVMLNRLL